MKPHIHLLCNAHLDPVWLWEWEEGAAEAIATFRIACEICEKHDTFIFNHNEVVLYEWVEEYEPELFARIQALVKEGKWHIMGGWYLQPDCNMPSGESLARQMVVGRTYFQEKFGKTPTTAINFDPFGHSKGLVQIMRLAGFDSYIIIRPDADFMDLPEGVEEFVWKGFNDTEVLVCRPWGWYNSARGDAANKCTQRIEANGDKNVKLMLWGIGNHGGGPSKEDVKRLNALIKKTKDIAVSHSTAEAFFDDLRENDPPTHVIESDLNPFSVGCYTSQIRIKQKHRELENMLYATEKMIANAWAHGRMTYPSDDLAQALRDLLFAEFHDILPGSSIQPVEDAALRGMDHALEILSRLRARAFFALAKGEKRAKAGTLPILVYNPHPYPVTTTVTCEFQPADQTWDGSYGVVRVFEGKKELPAQVEKEGANLNFLDWRKNVSFIATLKPSQMNRFDATLEFIEEKPALTTAFDAGAFTFTNDRMSLVISEETGCIEEYVVDGKTVLSGSAALPVVMKDETDTWGMTVTAYDFATKPFTPLTPKKAATFAGVHVKTLAPVRVIEDGPVRTVVEALLGYGDSFIRQRYFIPKEGTALEFETRVFWNEKKKLLKLAFPLAAGDYAFKGQTAYGVHDLQTDGRECVAQKYVMAVDNANDVAFSVINDGIYAADLSEKEGLRVTLLRSPNYSHHPYQGKAPIPEDRAMLHIDQGERVFRFQINMSTVKSRTTDIDREALVMNERPFALSFFPEGKGDRAKPFVRVSDKATQVTTVKKAETSDALVIRVFEPTGTARTTTISIPLLSLSWKVKLNGFEIKTFSIDRATGEVTETNIFA